MVMLSLIITLTAHIDSIKFLSSKDINDEVLVWIIVEGLIYTFYVFRRIILISYWTCVKDPRLSTVKINCFTFVCLNTVETIWFIWGNVLFWMHVVHPDVKPGTDPKSKHLEALWKLMIFMIIYGYIAMIYYCCSIMSMAFVVFTMKN